MGPAWIATRSCMAVAAGNAIMTLDDCGATRPAVQRQRSPWRPLAPPPASPSQVPASPGHCLRAYSAWPGPVPIFWPEVQGQPSRRPSAAHAGTSLPRLPGKGRIATFLMGASTVPSTASRSVSRWLRAPRYQQRAFLGSPQTSGRQPPFRQRPVLLSPTDRGAREGQYEAEQAARVRAKLEAEVADARVDAGSV